MFEQETDKEDNEHYEERGDDDHCHPCATPVSGYSFELFIVMICVVLIKYFRKIK